MAERDPPFNKILIANRGEIAVRIIRTARDMGIETVAIYSDVDRDALHVLLADEKVYVGPPSPPDSYLNIDRIVDAAAKTGAEAVHPGYGFLAQNPRFAKALEEEGIVFIGPPARLQELLGRKLDTRRFFSGRGIPIVPGTLNPVSMEDAEDVAEAMGFPLIVKPTATGGGIGTSIVWNEEELEKAISRACSLAESAFCRPEVYFEKYFPVARHIEVQILADHKGNMVHLFERECSVQRRFQKLIEETPSPAITEEEAEHLYGMALRAASECGYRNAGTFEFLFDLNTGSFYLLEVNSRIQVEHPVTESVTGIDMVEQQIRIAAGERLPFSQDEISRRGHSFEARIYAEDPLNGFAPSTGVVEELSYPQGPWVRIDSGIYEGVEVTPFYDPLLMKVIVWGENREVSRRRMLRALEELAVVGVTTNVDLHRIIFSDRSFAKGDYTTRFIEEGGILDRLAGVARRRLPKRRKKKEGRVWEVGVDAWKLSSRFGYL